MQLKTNIKSGRRTLLKAGIILLLSGFLFASVNNYYFQDVLFDFTNGYDVGTQKMPYGMAIDPDGKVWFGFHEGYSHELVRSPGDTVRVAGIRCYQKDSTDTYVEVDFSPLGVLQLSDLSLDTLDMKSSLNGNCRGISIDRDGNILYTARSTLYKLDYKTGDVLAKWDPTMSDKLVITYLSAKQDTSSGYIYLAPYTSYGQMHVLDTDLNYVATGIGQTPTLQNAIEIRKRSNGTTQVFAATHGEGRGIFVFESPDPATTPFTLVDTIGNYVEETDTNTIQYIAWATSLDWLDKENGVLLLGNYREAKAISSTTGEEADALHAARWIALDVDTDDMLFMFGAPWYDMEGGEAVAKAVSPNVPSLYLDNHVMVMKPSGMTRFSDAPDKLILTDAELNCVQSTSFGTDVLGGIHIPFDLELGQNYPNPFNPMTTLHFNLDEDSNISIDIYDLQGKHRMNVVSGYYESGAHTLKVDLSGFPSGTYLYTFHTKFLTVSRKMTLMK